MYTKPSMRAINEKAQLLAENCFCFVLGIGF